MGSLARATYHLYLPIGAMILGACGGDGSVPSVIVRDSAGVTVVENRDPAWIEDTAWYLSSEPVIGIGVVDGPQEYQFFRATSAVKLDDGRIVVANGGTSELRFFDSDGRFLFAVGRPGDGPGEFRDLQWVWRMPGDSLLAYDFFPGRLTLFDPEGRYVSSVQVLSPDGRQVFVLGHFEDGSLVVQAAPVWTGVDATEGVFQDSVPVYRYSKDGSVAGDLGIYPFAEFFRFRAETGWRRTSLPFARSPLRTAAGSRFIFGSAEDYELRIYDPAGALRRVIRVLDSRRPVTRDDMERYRRRRLEDAERQGGSETVAGLLGRLPFPEFMPPYERVVADRSGNVWVADYRATSEEPRIWKVFDEAGRYLGDVEVPNELEVFEIGDDYVLGRAVDEFDVEYVRSYHLHK